MKASVTLNSWFTLALFLVFLVLKLTNVIHWSWWWVTAPLWGTSAIYLAVGLVCGVIGVVCWLGLKALDK